MPSFPEDLVLEGDGLLVRRPREEDVEVIWQACQDPEIPRFTRVPSSMTLQDVHDFRASGAEAAAAGEAFHAVAVDADDGRMLGSCGLVGAAWVDLVGEVGYWTVAEERGRGVATRATRTICRWAFDELGLERLELVASTHNAASNRVAERLGFTMEGTRRAALVPGHTGERGTDRDDANLWGLLPGELR